MEVRETAENYTEKINLKEYLRLDHLPSIVKLYIKMATRNTKIKVSKLKPEQGDGEKEIKRLRNSFYGPYEGFAGGIADFLTKTGSLHYKKSGGFCLLIYQKHL
jgi:hypothetical protein